ncbi:hypothetical protein N2152v2_006513 [Parachlorella kessleri]
MAGCKKRAGLELFDSSPTASTPSSLASSPARPNGAASGVEAAASSNPAGVAAGSGTLQQAAAKLAAWQDIRWTQTHRLWDGSGTQHSLGLLLPGAGCVERGQPGHVHLQQREQQPPPPQQPHQQHGEQQHEPVSVPEPSQHCLQQPQQGASHVVALHDHAQLLQVDTELLREGLRGARRQLQALQRQLLRMQREAGRQQTLAETLRMEKECEVRLAKSEAEAYRVAAAARNAAVTSLQKSVATLQDDKRRMEAYVVKLQGSLKALLADYKEVTQHRQQQHQQPGSGSEHDREAVCLITALVQQKAEQLGVAQRALEHSAQTALQLGGAVDSLNRQLAEAHSELATLRTSNAELAARLAGAETEAAQLKAQQAQQALQHEQQQQDDSAALRCQLAAAEQRCVQLEAANCQLAQQAGHVDALRDEFEEVARQLVAACDQNAALSERLAGVRQQVAQLTAEAEANAAEKAQLQEERSALEHQLRHSQAEVLSLSRMVRALRGARGVGTTVSAGVAGPTSTSGVTLAAGGLLAGMRGHAGRADGGQHGSQALPAGQAEGLSSKATAASAVGVGSTQRDTAQRTRRALAVVEADASESGSTSSSGEADAWENSSSCSGSVTASPGKASSHLTPVAFVQQQQRTPQGIIEKQGVWGDAVGSVRSASTAAAAQHDDLREAQHAKQQHESHRVQLQEEEVQVLLGAVKRLQGQNRQLSCQLAGGLGTNSSLGVASFANSAGQQQPALLPPAPSPLFCQASGTSLASSAAASPIKLLPAKAARADSNDSPSGSDRLAAGWGGLTQHAQQAEVWHAVVQPSERGNPLAGRQWKSKEVRPPLAPQSQRQLRQGSQHPSIQEGGTVLPQQPSPDAQLPGPGPVASAELSPAAGEALSQASSVQPRPAERSMSPSGSSGASQAAAGLLQQPQQPWHPHAMFEAWHEPTAWHPQEQQGQQQGLHQQLAHVDQSFLPGDSAMPQSCSQPVPVSTLRPEAAPTRASSDSGSDLIQSLRQAIARLDSAHGFAAPSLHGEGQARAGPAGQPRRAQHGEHAKQQPNVPSGASEQHFPVPGQQASGFEATAARAHGPEAGCWQVGSEQRTKERPAEALGHTSGGPTATWRLPGGGWQQERWGQGLSGAGPWHEAGPEGAPMDASHYQQQQQQDRLPAAAAAATPVTTWEGWQDNVLYDNTGGQGRTPAATTAFHDDPVGTYHDSNCDIFDSPHLYGHLLQQQYPPQWGQPQHHQPGWGDSWHPHQQQAQQQHHPHHHQQQQQQPLLGPDSNSEQHPRQQQHVHRQDGRQPDELANWQEQQQEGQQRQGQQPLQAPAEPCPCPPAALPTEGGGELGLEEQSGESAGLPEAGLSYEAALRMLQQLQAEIASMSSVSPLDDLLEGDGE